VWRRAARWARYVARVIKLVDHARREQCVEVKLVSHVTRYAAHRFYLRKRMSIVAHFFSLSV